jgi:RNA polymerase sigma-70 factor (ECF subfamily)
MASRYPASYGHARAAWPDVEVPADLFDAWVDARLGETGIDTLHTDDLYLACGCATGQPSALRAFDEVFADAFGSLHRRFSSLPSEVDDLRQLVGEKLFVGEHPKIRDYAARGELRAWLRVAVTRMLLNIATRETREIPVGEEFFLALPESTSPEATHIRNLYGEVLRAAFADAVSEIDARDRSLLRYAIVEGLGIDEIGRIYSVHRATAARWVGDAKDALGAALKKAMKGRLQVSESELASIVRAIQSEIDITLSRYLGEGA